jgi:hypothetical protein
MTSRTLAKLNRLLYLEEAIRDALNKTRLAQDLREMQDKLLEQIREVGKSGDLEGIIAVEKAIVQSDLDRYANSKGMVSSLKNAVMELEAVQNLLTIVDDKHQYAHVAKAYSFPKNRKSGLPWDEARQALSSHYARLNNLDKSRLADDEKSIIDARRNNIFNASKLYAHRQAKTLSVESKTNAL